MNIKAMRDVFGDYIVELGSKYKHLVVLDCDLSSSTKTNEFAKEFPNRFFNMGIAEQNMIGTALGFAISDKVPIVSGFSIFTTGRAWEFIRMACHDNLSVKIITTHGGIVGEDGSTHNALEDISIMSTLPNINVLIPSDNIELKQILDYAIFTEGPFYIRLPRGFFPLIHDEDYRFSIDKPDVIKKGSDICLIGVGYGSHIALKAAIELEKKNKISVEVINLSCIKLINKKYLLEELKNIRGIVVIEEHNIYCGLGSIIARILSETRPIPMRFIGVENIFVESGNRDLILDKYGLNVNNILSSVCDLLNDKLF